MTKATRLAYERHASDYIRHWSRRRYRRPRLLGDLVARLTRSAVVADLGCGPGQDVRYLRKRGYRAIGLDLLPPFLLEAKRRDNRVPLLRADLNRLPLKPGVLDGIWAAASLIHSSKLEVRRALGSWPDLVRPGGLLAATVVHGRASGIKPRGWIPGRYFSRWQKGELQRALERAGWDVLILETVTNRERKGRWLNLLAQKQLP